MQPDAGQLAAIVPAPEGVTAAEHARTVRDAIGVALRLTGMVRDEGFPAETAEFVAGQPAAVMAAVPYVLAAMVDDAKTPRELLAWLGWAPPNRYVGVTAKAPASVLLASRPRPDRSRECGTEGAWEEHQADGTRCRACETAHDALARDEQARARPARRRAAPAVTQIRPAQTALPFGGGDANAA
jgi:hypothetical protein